MIQKTIFFLSICLNSILVLASVSALPDESLQKANKLFQQGEYSKAIAQYEKAVKNNNLAFKAHLGLAQVFIEKGEYTKAEAASKNALKISPEHPDALNISGDILKLKGSYEKAKSNYQRALQIDANHLPARLNLGIMQWEWGEKELARQTLQYFISYYRSHSNLSAADLNIIAQACIYLDRFRDANDLFYEATKADTQLWQAYIPWGNLFLSKYNLPDATGVFEDALKINPNAAEAHSGLARCWRHNNFEQASQTANKALSINSNLSEAVNLLAEMEIVMGNFETALEKLEAPLQINPNSLSTRTLRALCFYFLKDDNKFANEESLILSINPKYGDLYYELAETLAKRYLFKESVDFYQKALALDPEHWAARAGLGTSFSRLGKEAAGKEELEKAFAKDPYNKHVGNLLRLFDEFPQYKTHETQNFTLRIHEKDDTILSKYAIALAEESYSDLKNKYATKNADPFILEIFPEHDDFAVRCFGMPGAQAFLGICFGNVVAMDSPRARTKGDFVWGETLWHELVHVSHLRLTNNRIPRWLAEGIAVYETSTAKPHWSMHLDLPFIMAFNDERVLPLKDLDSGFNRPTSPGQVMLSYFQASKVVEFIVKKYGQQKLLQTFPLYKSGMNTEEVVKKVFAKNIQVIDEEFKQYIKQIYNLDALDLNFNPHELKANSDDLENYLSKKLAENANNPFLNFQFGVYYKKEKVYDKAITYLQKAKELFPMYVEPENPYKHLAEIYLETGQKSKAVEELTLLTSLNGKDLGMLNLLAKISAETKNYSDTIEALNKIIYITPFDSDVHDKLASAYLAEKQYEKAISELQIHLLTEPQDLAGAHCELASAYLQAGRKSDAKISALAALEIAPNYDRAQEILLVCLE